MPAVSDPLETGLPVGPSHLAEDNPVAEQEHVSMLPVPLPPTSFAVRPTNWTVLFVLVVERWKLRSHSCGMI